MKARAALLAALLAAGCGGDDSGGSPAPPVATPSSTPSPSTTPSPDPSPSTPAPPTTAVTQDAVATLDQPWAMVFLPDGRLLVTEKPGRLRLVTTAGLVSAPIAGAPTVASAGQGGLLDVALDPGFAANRLVYLSFAESGAGGAGLAVARATLVTDDTGGRLDGLRVIWRQAPRNTDTRHYGGRLAFSPDGHLFVTAGERHQGAPAQDLAGTLGKIVRINSDGSVPGDNPFAGGGDPAIWTLGHRNPYGLVFASDGRLFESEMGPDAGDEFNLIERGRNYGWRIVSEGSDGGEPLPRHATRPDFAAPLTSWTPNIAPAGMIQYRGTRFVGWDGDFILAGLVQQGLVRVRVAGATTTEVARVALGRRIREVEQAPDGLIWVLEDGAGGRLVRLTPR